MYGFQWRRFDEVYDEDDGGHLEGYDQLKDIVDKLHNSPHDRRMVCSAWNPHQLDIMALMPCHFCWSVTVIDNYLNLFWAQRSCDLALGVPFNICSYALLLKLLAKEGGFKEGNLSGMLIDCQLYNNQLEGAKLQITRKPKELSTLEITNFTNIFDWTYEDLELTDYDPHPKIDFGPVAV